VTSPAGRQPGPDDGGTLPPPGGPPPTRVDPAVGADGAPARFGPYRVVRALARVKSFFDTGVFLPIQAAAAAALEAADAFLPGQREALRERRDVAVRSLRDAGFEVRSPRATPYLWIPVPGGRSSAEFAGLALERTGVVVMPGSDLGEGGEGWFRVALTRPPGEYGEAAERLAGLT